MEGETTGKFDIVVYGATGFTGALVAEYLFQSHGDIKPFSTWASISVPPARPYSVVG